MRATKLISLYGQTNPSYNVNVIEPESYNQFDAETNDPTSSFDNEMHSEAGGLKRMFKHRREIQKQRQKRRDLQARTKGQARIQRTSAKQTQAKSQVEQAKAMKSSQKGDIALANALASSSPQDSASSTGMSMGAKIGIGAGIGITLLIVGVVIYKSMKAKKTTK